MHEMRRLTRRLALILLSCASWPLRADDGELLLEAVFVGRFASYVQWPPNDRPTFTITVIGNHPIGAQLARVYADKPIQGKPVRIHTVAQVKDIGTTDMLFVVSPTVAARQAAIAHAQDKGILSVSDIRGFAELGGVIQINFVGQDARIKINYDAAVKSGLHIGAPLLSIATVLRKSQP